MTYPKELTREEFSAMREVCTDQPYEPDWQVFKVIDRGPGEYYRFTPQRAGIRLRKQETLMSFPGVRSKPNKRRTTGQRNTWKDNGITSGRFKARNTRNNLAH